MWNEGFEGWYFKHQKGDDMLAFIPGRAESGAFVQMISSAGARQFDVPELSAAGSVIRAGNCFFSRHGCRVDLPGVCGRITYGPLTPLCSDIMGPFRFFPMECRHGVFSMGHTLRGGVTIDGKMHSFSGGHGYIEKDSGTSFPSAYLWLQCNDFSVPCDLMVSVAHIPFGGICFTGCICAIVYGGQEYRLATYNGVHIHAADARHIRLSQGNLLLEIDLGVSHGGHPLRAPVQGQMSGRVRETVDAEIQVRLWAGGSLVLEQSSRHAACEFVTA
ncbi:MAG: tocopherol cyclase family protein [Faecalibacterium sp.]|jgi:hypothetical protein|nr:tocopherol cyclase family protein [Faecalibacterium sp.]